ncbi:hypothetical protein TRFO_13902 [Tritrichomonas foetus]|uniref:Transmembrane protein n=1 Tax=Tritrichomonas foetus TaxID=1144522 RepID=A0A1J4L193_9EUKA|nr:hypothetical protein TRFO_13902 [Tritrichomonas foetus]|eukprot:OHT15732.1 hypothetical protein TRFO_13902 [Tritrichomonas foetus]
MGVLNWTLFWPEASKKKILFHIYRHSIIILLTFLSIYLFPSMVTFYFLFLSGIEYSRNARYHNIFVLYATFTFAVWFTGNLFLPDISSSSVTSPKIIVTDLLRSIIHFSAIVFDRLTVKRFGISSFIATISFPILLAGSSQILCSMDHLGLGTHISAFCSDYPELTFIPLRLLGPSGLVMLVAFIASYTSQWRHTRVVPRYMSTLLFRVLAIIVFAVYSYQYFSPKTSKFVNVSFIYDNSKVNENVFNKTANLFIFVNPFNHTFFTNTENEQNNHEFSNIDEFTNFLIEKSQKNNQIFTFSHFDDENNQFLNVISENGELRSRQIPKMSKKIIPARLFLKDMLTIESEFGRLGFIVGREMFQQDYLTSKDVDLLVTYGGNEYDEKLRLPLRTAKLVSQMIATTRIHGSSYFVSYGVNSNGKFIFSSQTEIEEVIKLKVSKNTTVFNNIRFLLIENLILFLFFFMIFINLVPMRYVSNMSLSMRKIIEKVRN